MLTVGRNVDRYTVEAWVGAGAMADVYRVRHTVLGTLHALKVIRTATASPRVTREARAQATVRHANIVAVHDVFEVDGHTAILMDWVAGETLAARMDRGPISDPAGVALALAEGLAAIHAAGLIHRDLKPANVLVDTSGTPRIADFGLVKLIAGHDALRTHAGSLLGTPAYMAPEATFDSATVGPAVDVWAFGVIVYEMLTSTHPFLGNDLQDTLRRVRDARWTMPDRVPLLLQRVLSACLVRDPAARAPDGHGLLAFFGTVTRSLTTWGLDAPAEPAPASGSGSLRVHTPVSDNSTADLEAAALAGNLPANQGDLIGREDELLCLNAAEAAGARLVTVIGPGGAGKTRLATAWAASALPRFPGGAWFVDLSAAASVDHIAFAAGDALGVPLTSGDGSGVVAQAGRALAARGRVLVILDNAEQVVQAAADVVRRWRTIASRAVFVVTSRERLQVDGETLVEVESLTPTAAVALFTERARLADPRFDAGRHGTVLDTLVRRLDCMPLAIELAAARVRVLAPSELLKRFNAGMSLLKSGRRDAPTRQTSVEAAIAWSWQLLSAAEQTTLATLSCFRGTFTVHDAEGVLDRPDALDLVQALADKSLLRRSPTDDEETRFAIYNLVQAFADARRAEVATDGALAFVRHWATRGPELADAVRQASEPSPGVRLRLETENLLAAYALALEEEAECAFPILDAIDLALQLDAGPASARHRAIFTPLALQRLVDAQPTEGLRARARIRRLDLAGTAMDSAQCRVELHAIHAAGLPDGDPGVATARAHVHAHEGKHGAAMDELVMAIAAFTTTGRVGDRQRTVSKLYSLAHLCGREAEWTPHAESALLAARKSGDRLAEGMLLMASIATRLHARDYAEAERRALAVLAIGTATGSPFLVDTNIGNLGGVHWQCGRVEQAEEQFSIALQRSVGSGSARHESQWRKMLARVHLVRGEAVEAASAWEGAKAAATDERDPLRLVDLAIVGATVDHLGRRLDSALAKVDGALALLPAEYKGRVDVEIARWAILADRGDAGAAVTLRTLGQRTTSEPAVVRLALGFADLADARLGDGAAGARVDALLADTADVSAPDVRIERIVLIRARAP